MCGWPLMRTWSFFNQVKNHLTREEFPLALPENEGVYGSPIPLRQPVYFNQYSVKQKTKTKMWFICVE